MTHLDAHPNANQTMKVVLRAPHFQLDGLEHIAIVEDWWDRLTGKSWMVSDGNPAAIVYALRTGFSGVLTPDDEVVYAKIGSLGHLLHVSELAEVLS